MEGERNWDFPLRPSPTSRRRTQILPATVYRLIVNNRPFILRPSYLKFVTLVPFLKTGFANRSDGSSLKYIKIALVFTPISMEFLTLFFVILAEFWLYSRIPILRRTVHFLIKLWALCCFKIPLHIYLLKYTGGKMWFTPNLNSANLVQKNAN